MCRVTLSYFLRPALAKGLHTTVTKILKASVHEQIFVLIGKFCFDQRVTKFDKFTVEKLTFLKVRKAN